MKSARTTPIAAHSDSLTDTELYSCVQITAGLIQTAAQAAIIKIWNPNSFDALVNADAWKGYKAYREAFGSYPTHQHHLDSRAKHMAAELVARIVKQNHHQRLIVDSLLTDPAVWPAYASKVEIRNMKRNIKNYLKEYGTIPTDFFGLRPSPANIPSHVVPLACTDKQMAEFTTDSEDHLDGKAILRVKLATTSQPLSKKDWQWETITLSLPPILIDRLKMGGKLCRPSLRLSGGKVIADMVVEFEYPDEPTGAAKTVLGVDWGVSRTLTVTDCWYAGPGDLRTSGRPVFFQTRGWQTKLARRRRQADRLQTKVKHYNRLLETRPSQPLIIAKRDKLVRERERIWGKYHDSARQLAHAGARWLVEHAKALGADTIVIEDLRSLEAGDSDNPSTNDKINHQVRGLLFRLLRDKAQECGLRIITVNPAGTSSECGRCGSAILHHKASNDLSVGRGWATCTGCGLTGDRDHLAAEHVSLRGLRDQYTPKPKKKNTKEGTGKPVPQTELPPVPAFTVRRSRRPALRGTKHSSNFSGPACRVRPGRAVRTGISPRYAIDTLSRWSQREFHAVPDKHRDLHGLILCHTLLVKATPPRPYLLAVQRLSRN